MKYRSPFYGCTGIAPLGIVEISFRLPFSALYLAEKSSLGAKKPDIPVASDFGGVIAAILMIAKFIFAGSVQIFNIGRRREVFR